VLVDIAARPTKPTLITAMVLVIMPLVTRRISAGSNAHITAGPNRSGCVPFVLARP
jgi:ribosomal protein S8E